MSGAASQSQANRLLARLQEANGAWVPMPELARVCSPSGSGVGICVSRRIYDLRKRGHNISCYREKMDGKVVHTAYAILAPQPGTRNPEPGTRA